MAAEAAREREMHRYYQPWLESFRSTQLPAAPHFPPDARVEIHHPRSSSDKALTAFAQLGCLRLNAKRGVVTLFDSTNQYIIAEATKSLSLLSDATHAPGDELWFGHAFIERQRGVSADAMFPETYTAAAADGSTYTTPALVVPDIAAHAKYIDRGYAGRGVSFYCGVPIVTKLGLVIGVYTVTDDKPRAGVSPEELHFMADMAVIVSNHLEVVKSDRARARGERLINGIGKFIEGDLADDMSPASPALPSLTSPSEWTPDRGSLGRRLSVGTSRHPEFRELAIADGSTPLDESPPAIHEENDLSGRDSLSPRPQPHAEPSAKNVSPSALAEASEAERFPSPPKLPPASSAANRLDAADVFDRAAATLRHCVRADGVAFFDASSANLSVGSSMKDARSSLMTFEHTQVRGRRRTQRRNSLHLANHPGATVAAAPLFESSDSNSSNATGPSQSDSSTSHKRVQRAAVLGVSTRGSAKDLKLTERQLRRLVRRHPKGQCFIFDQFGRPASSDESSGSASKSESVLRAGAAPSRDQPLPFTRSLVKGLPGARTIVFLPLWDFAKQKWHAVVIIWSNDPSRLTNIQEDMSYLKAFNNALMTEMNRINLALSDTAKATFLANISHELRSPLHGILGSIEFLHDTVMDDFQQSLVIAVETCSKTLLDTVNHVLDHAKINNLTNVNAGPAGLPHQASLKAATTADTALTDDFDLATVVEEVVEAVYAGQVFRSATTEALDGIAVGLPAAARAMPTRRDHDKAAAAAQDVPERLSRVRLTLNIDDHASWRVRSQPGAIRRIVMNILGNALKYTTDGSIDVSLEVDSSRKSGYPNLQVLLRVTDTGQGMSGDFLKNHAFTAFSQEDSLATGTGLGLSIVRQIVDSLGGKIDLSSQKDVGTEICILLSLPKSQPGNEPESDRSILTEVREATSGLELCILAPDRLDQRPPLHRTLSTMPTLESSMQNLISQWFRINVTHASHLERPAADFFLYPEPTLINNLMDSANKLEPEHDAPIIVLCSNAFEAASLRSHGIHRLAEMGRIIEVISQPCGPQKLAKVMHRCLHRMKQRRNRPSVASSELLVEHAKTSGTSEPGSNKLVEPPAADRHQENLSTPSRPKRATDIYSAKGTQLEERAARRKSAPLAGWDASVSASATVLDPHKPRVLVVDDNRINLHLLITFVRKTNHPHESATNGLKALEAYKYSALQDGGQNRFKYILMDISMPVMDGMYATREIRKFEREYGIDSPAIIIALTGLGSANAQSDAYQAGFDRFLSKPIKFKELLQLLI